MGKRPEAQVQTQGGRRRFSTAARRPEYERGPWVSRGADLQSAQGRSAHLRQPAQHGGEAAGLQSLLGCPQALLRGVGVDQDQALRRHPLPMQRRHMGHKGGRDEEDVPSALHDLAQGRGEQSPLGLTGLLMQHLGQRLTRPAPTGQLPVELGVAAGQHPVRAFAQGVPQPDGLGQVRRQTTGGVLGRSMRGGCAAGCHDTVWIYSIVANGARCVQFTMTPLRGIGFGLFLPSPVHPPGFWQNDTP